MRTNNLENKIISLFVKSFLIFGFFLNLTNIVYAIDTYQPGETITLGEFIYNDDYSPTADNCKISIYSPGLVPQVTDATMTDEGTVATTGWHYYTWTTLSFEGKYPAFITCGSEATGDLFKLDKSFIVKSPVVTDASISSIVTNATSGLSTTTQLNTAVAPLVDIKAKTDTIDWTDVTNIKGNVSTLITQIGTGNISAIKTKTDSIAWGDVTGLITSTGDIKGKTDTIAWGDVTGIKTNTDTIVWGDVTAIKTKTDTIIWGDVSTIKSNVAALVSEIGTGNITGIKTKTDSISWNDVTGLVTSNGLIKAKTDTIAWNDITGIKTKTDTIDWANVTGIKTKTDNIVWGDISSIKAKTDTIDWSDITNLPSNIWSYSGRTLTAFGSLASDIWNNTYASVRKLTSSTIDDGSGNTLATTAQLNSAVSPLSTTADVTASTGTITGAIGALHNITAADVWNSPSRSLTTFGTLVADIWGNASRTITGGTTSSSNMLAAADVWSYGTRNLTDGTLTSGSLSKVSDLSGLATAAGLTSATSGLATSNDLTSALSSVAKTSDLSPLATSAMLSLVKTKTDSIDWTDITTIKNNAASLITEIGTGNITGIKTKTDSISWNDVTGLVTSNGLIKAKTDTIAWNDITGIKTKTDTIDWANVTGLITSNASIKGKTDTILWSDISALAKVTDVTNAVSPLAKTTDITTATSSINSNTNSQVASAISSVNSNTNSGFTNIVAMINNVPLNVWNYSTRTLTSFGSLVSDIWSAVTRTLTPEVAPGTPQVIINSMPDTTSPSISSNITITNESSLDYEYQYEWCVVLNLSDNCGEPNNIYHEVAAKKIIANENFNTTLIADNINPGTYYFKLKVHFGNDHTLVSEAYRSFTATSISTSAGGGGSTGNNGGDDKVSAKCSKISDFNCDGKVNSIDFSILLYFWKSSPPFKNLYVDLNKDSKVDSVDFSILLYRWDK